jgi:hypothetical protein
VGTRPEAAQVPRRRHAGSRPPAGLGLEPKRLETAGRTPHSLASKPATSRPNQESWDFDENKQDFREKKNPPKPHASHETSPVSGASVVGMTYGAYHGPSNMPADVPGIPTASTREDRLRPKGQLRQQPACDSAEESWSRVQKIRFPQRRDRQKRPRPDKIDRGQGRDDARHNRPRPIRDRRPFPTTGSKAKEKGYAFQMPV